MTGRTKVPLLPVGGWAEHAACRGKPTRWWFPNRYDDSGMKYRAARQVCNTCPVLEECLDFALSVPVAQDLGMWGGTSRSERLSLRDRIKHNEPEQPDPEWVIEPSDDDWENLIGSLRLILNYKLGRLDL